MAKSARARSTCAGGAVSERLRRVSSWRSSAVSGRRGSFRWRDMGHLGARGSPHYYTSSHGRRPTSAAAVADRLGTGTRQALRKVRLHPFEQMVEVEGGAPAQIRTMIRQEGLGTPTPLIPKHDEKLPFSIHLRRGTKVRDEVARD